VQYLFWNKKDSPIAATQNIMHISIIPYQGGDAAVFSVGFYKSAVRYHEMGWQHDLVGAVSGKPPIGSA
jgi:hypothetical protein